MKNQFIKRNLVLAIILSTSTIVTTLPQQAFAYDETSTSALNVDKQGLAIKGFDPVAYFTESAPIAGSEKFSATYKGARYHFANAKNRDAFKANSEKFVPQYGGFCAMGVALGKKLDGDPQAWRVVDNKLYLNVNKEVQTKWLEDVPGNLKKADSEWPQVSNKAPKDL
jgi:YHS domain-containing protein